MLGYRNLKLTQAPEVGSFLEWGSLVEGGWLRNADIYRGVVGGRSCNLA